MSERVVLPVKRLRDDAVLPRRASEGAAGFDLVAALDAAVILPPGEWRAVPTGIAIALPTGHEAQIRPRSGLAARHGVTVLNSPGTIDEDYRGEIQVLLINHGKAAFTIEPRSRIAQMLIAQVPPVQLEEVDILDETIRGSSGFGSTGV